MSEISVPRRRRRRRGKKMHLSVSLNTQSSFNPTITTINTLLSSSSSSSSSSCSFHTKNPFFFKQQQRRIRLSSSKDERVVFQSDHCPIVVKTNEHNPWVISEEEKIDGFYMKRCIEVAKKGMGYTCPDPMVGCVIVKDNVIVGEGFYTKNTHLYPGGVDASDDGAEVMALREAGDLAIGATAYINLNNSNISSISRTELILAGVKRIVPGTSNSDEWLCKKLNELSIHRKLTGKPLLTLRCSVSLNGRILDHLGEGANECGGYYSQLLQEYDGIILSNASLLKQQLSFPTSNEVGAKQPVQIVVTRTPSHPNPSYSPHVQTMATIKSNCEKEKEEDKEVVLALDNIFRSDFRETVVSKNLRTIIDHCGRQGMSGVLFDVYRSSVDFQELIEEGLELGLFQKVVLEILPVWDSSSIRDEAFGGGLHRLMKDLVEKGDLQLPISLPLRITKDNVVVVESYFEPIFPYRYYFNKIPPIMKC